eukprot:scaffold328_cov248-Pinguiococcus_pyrenoidosus.AAC.1
MAIKYQDEYSTGDFLGHMYLIIQYVQISLQNIELRNSRRSGFRKQEGLKKSVEIASDIAWRYKKIL